MSRYFSPAVLRRTAYFCLCLSVGFLLSACVSRPPQPVYTNITLPLHWEAEGKAAVRSIDPQGQERGGNVYFTWTQHADSFRIIVRGPLGLGRAELNGTPSLVSLKADNMSDMSAGSLDELAERALHRPAPVSNVLHWIKAEPASNRAVISRDAAGKISQIKEDGWTVDYVEWSTEAPHLPRKLTLTGSEGRATVVVGLWRLNLSATAP